MKKQQAPVTGVSINNLEQQALSLSDSGEYKDAIALYEKLMHDSDKSEWREQLAFCYLQSALALAAKGEFKEALVLWEMHSQYTQPPYQAIDYYISWLIQNNNPGKLQTCLGEFSAQQLDKQYPALAGLLGSLMLTEHPEFALALPQDSALIMHFKVVEKALQAYQENDLEAVYERLKQLPYRSAFRDFRTLLKAAITAQHSLTQAQAMIAKIPANSPYAHAAKMLLAFTCNGASLVHELLRFNAEQRRMIGVLKGLNERQIDFIEELCKQKYPLSDKIKFNLAIHYQSLIGTALAQRYCQGMLAIFPAGLRDYNDHFDALSEFDEFRLKALAHEHDNNNHDAIYYWQQCIQALIREGAGNDLKIALILRHIAGQQETSEETGLLIESLEYDPDDRSSYLQILSNFSQLPESHDQYKHWLSKTLKKFPQDIDVLTLAVHQAMGNKAYKKASQYALNILKKDALNSFAKQLLERKGSAKRVRSRITNYNFISFIPGFFG